MTDMKTENQEQKPFVGVLIIPNDERHPGSFSWVSPREKKVVRDPRTNEDKVEEIVYTFYKGRPARIQNEADYNDLLREQAYQTKGRGFVPMFQRVDFSKGPARVQAGRALFSQFIRFLQENNISVEDMVQAAQGAEVSMPVEEAVSTDEEE